VRFSRSADWTVGFVPVDSGAPRTCGDIRFTTVQIEDGGGEYRIP